MIDYIFSGIQIVLLFLILLRLGDVISLLKEIQGWASFLPVIEENTRPRAALSSETERVLKSIDSNTRPKRAETRG